MFNLVITYKVHNTCKMKKILHRIFIIHEKGNTKKIPSFENKKFFKIFV